MLHIVIKIWLKQPPLFSLGDQFTPFLPLV